MTDHSGQYLGRYYLTERLGEGGMAVVYKAYDTRLERDVAVKIIRSGVFPPDDLEQVLKRFEREAKALAKLSHHNIVKVYDFGEHEGSPYLVMEYLPGGTLKKILGKPVPWQDAVRLILPVARGVAYAHRRGILHRDIKPANVLITDDGEPMLSDFGIAKLFEGDQTTALTGSGMAIGTPEYMAPEQWTGVTSPQSDQYALGIVLYEMVAGRKPYIADTPGAILIKQVTEPLPGPRKFVADLPEALEHVLIKALAREPGDRYKDVNALINALENLHVNVPVVTAPELKPVEDTYRIPAPKHDEPAPTEIVTIVSSDPVAEETVKPQKLEESHPPETRAVKPKHPIKFSLRGVGILIGGVAIVSIAVIWASRLNTPLAPVSSIANIATRTDVAPTTTFVSPSETISATSTSVQTLTPTFTPLARPTVTSTPAAIYETQVSPIDSMTMILIPAGEFMMGRVSSERLNQQPVHPVNLSAFWIDRTEVSNKMYALCVKAGGCRKPRLDSSNIRQNYYSNPDFADYPVIYVNFFDATTYCKWAGRRLLTEAEWEKAAHGTDDRLYAWGDKQDCSFANVCSRDTEPVSSYENGASPYGVLNMTGNVWEWVGDVYDEDYYSRSPKDNPVNYYSPTVNPDYAVRISRGGGWEGFFDVYFRNEDWLPAMGSIGTGIRCAKDATP